MQHQFAHLKMLYVGPLDIHGTCFQRMKAFEGLKLQLNTFDTSSVRSAFKLPHIVEAALLRVHALYARPRMNSELINAALKQRPDIVWIDKGVHISPASLMRLRKELPSIKLISYSPDDMFNPRVSTSTYKRCIPIYDLHITTKSYNISELREAGAKDVLFIDNAYDETLHRPIPVNEADREKLGGDVGFIGSFEQERAESLTALANAGIVVRIWGDWPKRSYPAGLKVEGRSLKGEEYVRAINAFAINLCFLRKANRDLQTTRSIEIPACGAFMLAERTAEHQRLFEEGKEAAYFSSDEELISSVKHYLTASAEREQIAAAALTRCQMGGYSNIARLSLVLNYIFSA